MPLLGQSRRSPAAVASLATATDPLLLGGNALGSPASRRDHGDPTSAVNRTVLLAGTRAPDVFFQVLASSARARHWRLVTDLVHTGATPSRLPADGIISFAAYPSAHEPDLADAAIPHVSVSLIAEEQAPHRVEPDQVAIGQLAARHLLERECGRFIWAPFTDDAANHSRLRGYQSVIHGQGFDCELLPPAYRRIGHAWNDNTREWRDAALALLTRLRSNAGVFAFNDCMASKVAALALEAGLIVPEQVAIVGVGNDPLDCESGPVPLSSVDPDIEGMTRRAVEVLDQLIENRRAAGVVWHPPKGIITRSSSAVDRLQGSRIQQAIALVATHSMDPHLSVAAIADKVGISRRQLERDFRNLKGCTVRSYIEDTRMETAARLILEQPHSKVLAIAEAIGISDPNNFYRKFRKRFGTTPTAYRRQFAPSSDFDTLRRQAS